MTKSSEILRRAARLVEDGRFYAGCFAINYAALHGGNSSLKAGAIFRDLLYRETDSGYWWPERPRHGPRIIGLCLAAAIAESEGD